MSDPRPSAGGDPQDTALVVHPPRLVEMTSEQHQQAVRLLIALIDSWVARRRATHDPPPEPARTPSSGLRRKPFGATT